MNSEAAIGEFCMPLVEKQLAVSMLRSTSNAVSEKVENEILGYMTSKNQQFLQIAIFSPDWVVRDFLHGILVFQGYHCTKIGEFQDIVHDLPAFVNHVVFLDGWYLVGPELEGVLSRAQLLSQAGVRVFVLADRDRQWDPDLATMQNSYGWGILWKPLDYRQVGQVMAQM
jgi:hypothetical protein